MIKPDLNKDGILTADCQHFLTLANCHIEHNLTGGRRRDIVNYELFFWLKETGRAFLFQLFSEMSYNWNHIGQHLPTKGQYAQNLFRTASWKQYIDLDLECRFQEGTRKKGNEQLKGTHYLVVVPVSILSMVIQDTYTFREHFVILVIINHIISYNFLVLIVMTFSVSEHFEVTNLFALNKVLQVNLLFNKTILPVKFWQVSNPQIALSSALLGISLP